MELVRGSAASRGAREKRTKSGRMGSEGERFLMTHLFDYLILLCEKGAVVAWNRVRVEVMRCLFFFFFAILWLPGNVRGHPAFIGDYPERFPGKTLQAIRLEWEPLPQDGWTDADLQGEAQVLVEGWSAVREAEREARIKHFAAENRRGDYRKRFANLAHDMADLVAAKPAEAESYLAWRLDHLAEDDGFFDGIASGARDEKPAERDERTRRWHEARDQETHELVRNADAAGADLRPHWLIQAGALEFRHRRYREAEGFYRRVMDGFPKHPRAEVATLMLARLRFDEWRQEKRSYREDGPRLMQLQNAWWSACQSYRDQYAAGRFLLDLAGWEAGYHLENGNVRQAMEIFLSQAADAAHPEVRRRAFQQIEWLLRDLVEVETLPWDRIAREPLVALRLGYHLLDARSQTDLGAIMQRRSGEDHRVLESLVPDLRAVRSRAAAAWTALDQALDREAEVFHGKFAPVREALHIWSLNMRGRASVATGMEEKVVSGPGEDDRALARAFAWIKAGRPAESLRVLEAFQTKYAASHLNRGLTLRRVDAWIELGGVREALILLWDMMEGHDTATLHESIESSPALHLPGEVTQRVAAVLSFAPLEKLAAAAEAAKERPHLRSALCGALRTRHLSRGEFDDSLAYAAAADFEHWQDHQWGEEAAKKATRWQEAVSTLKQLSQQAKDAASWNALAQAWQRQPELLDGGRVYLPQPYFVASVSVATHELRSLAAYLHLSDTAAAAMLDSRQVHTQARMCFEKAENLEALHECLRERAEVSPYWMDRAVETGDGLLSHELVGKIQRPEIVSWSLRPANALGEWKPGRSALWHVEVEIASVLGSITEGFWEHDASLKKLSKQVRTLVTGDKPLSEVRTELGLIREAVKHEAPVLKAASLLNHIDDFNLLAAHPGVERTLFSRYAALRLQNQPMPQDDPAFQPVKDFVGFWNAVITPSGSKPDEASWRRVSAEAQVRRMTTFLAEFPKSAKRESALARLAVNTLRMSRCHCALKTDGKGYAAFVVERGAPFDLQSIQGSVENYEREFPSGRYLPEMRLVRGLAAAEAANWESALGHLIPLLNAAAARDLHLDASNTVAAIFMKLLESEQRLAVKSAIETVPGARKKLAAFLHTPSCAWRLRLLDGWMASWMNAPEDVR